MTWGVLVVGLICGALAACAAPAVTLYTLAAPAQDAAVAPLGPQPVVIAVDRIALPDDLDTQDIMVRHGSVLESSHQGRWASRLSLAATDLVTALLAKRRPDALVTDQPQTASPSYRLLINISRLDLATPAGGGDGMATLDADWLIVPGNAAAATMRDRTHIEIAGKMATDQDVVVLTKDLLSRLAGSIGVAGLR